MQGNILQAMQLDFVRVRCLFEINELSRAKEYLRDKLEEYREVTRLLIIDFSANIVRYIFISRFQKMNYADTSRLSNGCGTGKIFSWRFFSHTAMTFGIRTY